MTVFCFLYQPRQNVAPFEPLPVEPEVGFTTNDDVCPGDFLGTILRDKHGAFRYCQRSVSFRIKLSPRNLRIIAERIEHLQNEEEKLHTKAQTSRKAFHPTPRH